jgi:very-short-patch-repair endonuclease
MTPNIDSGSMQAFDLLEQQSRRRLRSVPTVSVLAGAPLGGLRVWRRWLAGSSRPHVITAQTTPTVLVRLIALALVGRSDLASEVLTALAGWLGRLPSELRSKLEGQTAADRAVFLETLPVDRTRDPIALSLVLIGCLQRGALPSPEQFLDQLTRELGWLDHPELRLLVALAGIVPESRWPTLFLVDELTGAGPRWVEQALQAAAALAVALPQLSVGMAVNRETLDLVFRTAGESRALALAREGTILLPSVGEGDLLHEVAQAGLTSATTSFAIAEVTRRGADKELAGRLVDVARAVANLDVDDEVTNDRARSLAEQFLHDLLESHPMTTGLFKLNGPLDFPFGRKQAEVDLLAPGLRLVIELDGRYWHLSNLDAYRRDRRKDWELQRRGFLVLRFLAEDVVCRLQDIWDTILTAVTERLQSIRSLGEHT